jgi:hypothetical protein
VFKSIAEPHWPDSAPAQSELAAKFQRYVLEGLRWAETLVGDDLGSVRRLCDLFSRGLAYVFVIQTGAEIEL